MGKLGSSLVFAKLVLTPSLHSQETSIWLKLLSNASFVMTSELIMILVKVVMTVFMIFCWTLKGWLLVVSQEMARRGYKGEFLQMVRIYHSKERF